MITILKNALGDFLDDRCTRIAAAIAYYTAFSLAPILVLLLSIGQLAFEPEDLQGRVRTEITNVVGSEGAEQIETMLESNRAKQKRGVVASIISGVILVVGATGLFAQLQAAMNDVWEVKPDPKSGGIKQFITKRLMSLGMLLTLAFLVMVSITASSVIHTFDEWFDRWLPGQSGSALMTAADYIITLAVLTLMFAAMFRFLPDARVAWGHVWVGALVTGALFLLGKFGIALYVGTAGTANAFGAAGSFVVILVWVYYSALIFLFGAEFTQAWAKHYGSGIVPQKGAVRVVTNTETVETN